VLIDVVDRLGQVHVSLGGLLRPGLKRGDLCLRFLIRTGWAGRFLDLIQEELDHLLLRFDLLLQQLDLLLQLVILLIGGSRSRQLGQEQFNVFLENDHLLFGGRSRAFLRRCDGGALGLDASRRRQHHHRDK
jgi:hypothetical protein